MGTVTQQRRIRTLPTLKESGRSGPALPGGIQRQKLDSLLQHGLEAQRQRERHLGYGGTREEDGTFLRVS